MDMSVRDKNGSSLWGSLLPCKLQCIIQENVKIYFETLKNDEGKTILADLELKMFNVQTSNGWGWVFKSTRI